MGFLRPVFSRIRTKIVDSVLIRENTGQLKVIFQHILRSDNSVSFRRQYGKRANVKTEVTRKQCTPNFPKNKYFSPPDEIYSGGKKCSFFGKFGVHCFLVTSVLGFALLLYYRRVMLCTFSFCIRNTGGQTVSGPMI